MLSTTHSDKNADTVMRFDTIETSQVRTIPFVLFVKVSLTVFFCEVVIMAIFHLLPVSSKWAVAIDAPLLTVLSMFFVYRFIIKPINCVLEISEKAKSKLELFKGLIDKSNDAIFIINLETGGVLDVNYKACILLGYARDDFLKMTVMDIDEVVRKSSVWAEYVGKIKNERYAILQGRYKRKNGTTFPVEVTASVIEWGGREFIVAIARDVTDREFAQTRIRESETKFRKMAECAKDAIIIMGPKGEISFWNSAAERIFGYFRSEAIGKNLHTMLAPKRFHDSFKKGFAGFEKTGQGSAMGKTLKLAAVRKDGSEFNIELSVTSLQMNGQWHAVGIVRDISERKDTTDDWTGQNNAVEVSTESRN